MTFNIWKGIISFTAQRSFCYVSGRCRKNPISTEDLHWNLCVSWMLLSTYTLHIVSQLELHTSSLRYSFIGLQSLKLTTKKLTQTQNARAASSYRKIYLDVFQIVSPETLCSGRHFRGTGAVEGRPWAVYFAVRALLPWNVLYIKTFSEMLSKTRFYLF